MKICNKCGKRFSDDPKFCDNCGNLLDEIVNQPPVQPKVTEQNQTIAGQAVQQSADNIYYPAQPSVKAGHRGDFRTAPTGINIISIVGFVLSFICIGFVWIAELSIVVFPVALIALVLCTIVKAMKYDNIFAKIGFIVALVVTIIAGIVFGVYLYENIM